MLLSFGGIGLEHIATTGSPHPNLHPEAEGVIRAPIPIPNFSYLLLFAQGNGALSGTALRDFELKASLRGFRLKRILEAARSKPKVYKQQDRRFLAYFLSVDRKNLSRCHAIPGQ